MIAAGLNARIERGSFGGHETFPLRYTWLRKAVEHVERDPEIFLRDDAMVVLGVGKNMVRAIRHWALVCGMIHEDADRAGSRGRVLRPTPLGRQLLGSRGWDPYMEDPATLWVVHFELASSPAHATSWYWAFNHLPQPQFSKAELTHWLTKLAQDHEWTRVSPASLKRDIDVFLRTYVPARVSKGVPLEDTLDCPLVELGLMRELDGRGTFVMQRGEHPTLPDPVFAYALGRFLERRQSVTKAVPIHSIAFAPGSPGRVFALTEDALMRRLESLERATDGALVFHDTAGLKQVLVREVAQPQNLLGKWYRTRGRGQS